MKQIIELQLPHGKTIFVEAEPDGTATTRELSREREDRITKKFEEISETLGALAESLEGQLSKLVKAPKKVEVEIHAVMKTDAKLFIVQGSAEGGLKLRLTWER